MRPPGLEPEHRGAFQMVRSFDGLYRIAPGENGLPGSPASGFDGGPWGFQFLFSQNGDARRFCGRTIHDGRALRSGSTQPLRASGLASFPLE